jgi:hypothetical protein
MVFHVQSPSNFIAGFAAGRLLGPKPTVILNYNTKSGMSSFFSLLSRFSYKSFVYVHIRLGSSDPILGAATASPEWFDLGVWI